MLDRTYQQGLIMPQGQPSPGLEGTQPVYGGGGLEGTQPVPGNQPAPANPNPWAGTGYDPTKPVNDPKASGTLDFAKKGLAYAAQQGWGKQLTDADYNVLAQVSGYGGTGNVTADQYNKALAHLGVMFGQQGQTPGKEGTQPVVGPPGNVGPGPAGQQYQSQQPIAGVPPTFAQANPYQQQQQQLMQQILANPQTMGLQQQQQLMERQKESAGRMQKQANAQSQQQSLRSGFGAGGGQQAARQNQNQQDMISQLLSGQRDVALQAGQQNRQDELNALQASSQLAQQGFSNDMQRAQMGLNQMNQNRGQSLQEWLANQNVGLDRDKFNEGNKQFNKQYGLDFLRYLAQNDQFNRQLAQNNNQFNQNMGLQWNQANAQQQMAFLNALLSGF